MKTFIVIVISIISIDAFSQHLDWVSLGKDLGYDFYYKKNSVVRGNRTLVTVVGIPLQEMRDADNRVIKFVSIDVIFYKADTGIRSLITNHLFFYDDTNYRKAGLPKRDLPLTYFNILMKLYNEIR